MKRLSVGLFILSIVGIAGFIGFGTQTSEISSVKTRKIELVQDSVEKGHFVGMANPWCYNVSQLDVEQLVGRQFHVPEGATNVSYGIMSNGKLAEMKFSLNGTDYTVRMKPSSEVEDISGLYFNWDADGVDSINGLDAHVRIDTEENISNVLWFDGKMMYSVYSTNGNGTGLDVVEIAKLI